MYGALPMRGGGLINVLSFIASKVQSNIRELEGALIRVTAFASLWMGVWIGNKGRRAHWGGRPILCRAAAAPLPRPLIARAPFRRSGRRGRLRRPPAPPEGNRRTTPTPRAAHPPRRPGRARRRPPRARPAPRRPPGRRRGPGRRPRRRAHRPPRIGRPPAGRDPAGRGRAAASGGRRGGLLRVRGDRLEATSLRHAWAQIDETLRAGLTFAAWCQQVTLPGCRRAS
jgi:Bacterial dnaA  protein